MISIIICSRKAEIEENLFNNIIETVGVEQEIIFVDNSQNQYSIFEAYNIGIRKSKQNIVCFIHDDIHFVSQNWGQVLIEIFDKNHKIGLVGVAGSKSKTKIPSTWWNCPEEDLFIHINQYLRNGKKEYWHKGFAKNNLEDVVIIDGVFMAARKDSSILFNTQLTGFHNYDLNFSFEYLKKGYRVVVTQDILLDHFSIGVLNESWYRSTLQIHKLYDNILPLNKSKFIPTKNYEFENGQRFIKNLLNLKMKAPAFYLWTKLFMIKPISKFHFYFFKSLFQ